jgi:hypothetical protein
MDSKEPEYYQVTQKFSACEATVNIVAKYRCSHCNHTEWWQFIFYLWRMPTSNANTFNYSLSKYEKKQIESREELKILELYA